MINFWQVRTLREKIMLATGIIFCLFLVLYYSIIPLLFTSTMQQDRQRFQQQLSFVRWAQHIDPYIKVFKTVDFNLLEPDKVHNWPSALRQSLGNSSLSEALSIINQSNNQISLQFNHVDFDLLINRIYGWELLGFKIVSLTGTQTTDPGYANVKIMINIPSMGATHET